MSAAAPPSSAPPRRRWRRFAGLAAALLCVLAVTLGWLLASEGGLRAAVRLATWASGGQLQFVDVRGRVLGPLSIAELRFESAAQRFIVRELATDWQPAALLQRRLHVDRLQMAELRLATAPDPDAGPLELPRTLRLPLALEVGRLQVGRVVVEAWPVAADAAPQFLVEALSGALRSDAHSHVVTDLELQLPAVTVTVDALSLAVDPPYALAATGGLQGSHEEREFAARFSLAGDLAEPQLALQASGAGLSGELQLHATPFAAVPLRSLQLALSGLDPAAFHAAAPHALLRLEARLAGVAGEHGGDWALTGTLAGDNAVPGAIDGGQLPLERFSSALRWEAGHVGVHDMALVLAGGGRVAGSVQWIGDAEAAPVAAHREDALRGRVDAALTLQGVDPARVRGDWPALPIDGVIEARAEGVLQSAQLRLQTAGARLEAELTVDGGAAVTRFEASARLREVVPQRFLAAAPAGKLGLDVEASGKFGEAVEVALDWRLVDARIEGRAFSGDGRLALAGERIVDAALHFALGDNRLRVDGAWGAPADRLRFNLDAPRLDSLGFGIAGRAGLVGELGGTAAEPAGHFILHADHLSLPGDVRVDGLNAQGRMDAGLDGPLQLALGLSGVGDTARRWLDSVALAVDGRRSAHRITVHASTAEDSLSAALDGGLGGEDGLQWSGRIDELAVGGRFPARLQAPVGLRAGSQHVELDAAHIEAGEQGSIRFLQTLWTPQRTVLRGTLSGLALGLQTRADGRPRRGPGPLVLGAEWDLRLAASAEGELRIFREAGDLEISGEISTRLGLEHLEAWLTARDNRLALAVDARGSEFGSLNAALTALAERGPGGTWGLAPEGALLGSARLQMPSIAWMGRLLQENVDTAGSLEAEFSFSGTPAAPLAAGRIRGRDLAVALVDQGLQLSGGELLAEFDRDRLRLTRLSFVSPNRVRPRDNRPPVAALTATAGTLEAGGEIALDSGEGHFSFTADRLPMLQRVDRWLIVSGRGEGRSTWTSLALNADLRADAGYVEFAETPAPSLSDDVVVLGREAPGGSALAIDADIRVAMGDHLYFSALGVDTRLTGALRVRMSEGRPLTAVGTIATAGGVFRGYGQNLSIERGLINFQGAVDNPGLNIVALRKGLAVEAGVAIGGSVRRPQVRLVSEPTVPDPEKLSWIVLGRPPAAGSGADLGLLLPAAQALLGGPGGGMTEQLSRSLGFDEFAIGQGEVGGISRRATSRVVGSGTAVDDGGVGGQVLTVGKRLSADLLLSFEQSLGGAESLVKLTYQLSRQVSLVARGGSDNAVDLYYTISFR